MDIEEDEFKDFSERTTEEIDDVIDEQLDRIFEDEVHGNQIVLHDLARIATDFDPIDLAHAVTRLPAKARWVVFDHLPDIQSKIIFIEETGSNTRAAIFKQLTNLEIKNIIENMQSNDVVEVFEDLSERRFKQVLEILDPKKAKSINELQAHGRLTAGRLMTNEFFAFSLQTTIGEVRKEIRNRPGIDLTSSIFILNDEKELIGYVPDRSLMVNSEETPLRQVMGPIQHKVFPDTPRDDVVDIVDRYYLPALPVVDDQDHLLGVVAYEEAVEAMRDIADATIASIGGTTEDISEDEPLINRILLRSPWLLATLCAGLTTSTIMTHFKGNFWFEFAPFFVPLIAMMSGNVGIQCSTILVRWMAQGEFSSETKRDAITSELMIGSVLGISFGLISGLVVYLLISLQIYQVIPDPFSVTLMVSIGLFVACLGETCLGTLSPIIFDRLNIDPAVASGPIVAALNDMISTSLFILVAYTVYHLTS
ncbi:magnesium transporter [Chlamydiales bacterium]|nr:magnesium transporter [Chlamydiales bacterium]